MAGFNERAYELNEVTWWSAWTKTVWLNKDMYILFSEKFDEYFFNRAGFLNVAAGAEKSLKGMEEEFRRRGRTPCIFLQDSPKHPRIEQALARDGYKTTDRMSIMELGTSSFKVNSNLVLETGLKDRLEDWGRVYLDAFYGDERYLNDVLGILRQISKSKAVTLVLASLKGEPVGCLVLFRSDGMCGVYCVGTSPSSRNTGVASTMLDFSQRLAAVEGRRIILQTILSDALESFYSKLGFRRVYVKDLYVKNAGDEFG